MTYRRHHDFIFSTEVCRDEAACHTSQCLAVICVCIDECSRAVARYFISQQHPSWCSWDSVSNWCWQVSTDNCD